MVEKEFKIENKVGLHARPASIFVQTAKKFKSKIKVIKDGNEADAKSIIGVLSLGVEKGDSIVVRIEGDDEERAMKEIENLINNKFGEE